MHVGYGWSFVHDEVHACTCQPHLLFCKFLAPKTTFEDYSGYSRTVPKLAKSPFRNYVLRQATSGNSLVCSVNGFWSIILPTLEISNYSQCTLKHEVAAP